LKIENKKRKKTISYHGCIGYGLIPASLASNELNTRAVHWFFNWSNYSGPIFTTMVIYNEFPHTLKNFNNHYIHCKYRQYPDPMKPKCKKAQVITEGIIKPKDEQVS